MLDLFWSYINFIETNLPRGSQGIPLKMILYVVRNIAPSAGNKQGPPNEPPTPSSRPSGNRYTRKPSITISSPGRIVGSKILGYDKKDNRTKILTH